MNNEIFIKENFKVDDTHSKFRGFVFAYDENNKLVFVKENMIVESGRRFIINNSLKNAFENNQIRAFLSSKNDMVEAGEDLPEESIRVDTKQILNLGSISNIDNLFVKTIKKDNIFEDHIFSKNNDSESDTGIIIKNSHENIDESSANYFGYIFDNDTLSFHCLIIFNDTDIIEANSLGLIVNDGTNDILFSRVTFPTYYKSATQRLTFKYYIYF